MSILLGQTDGTFGAKTDYPVGTMPVAIASVDFNADGVADLAVTNHTSNTVSILLGNGDGTFGLKTISPPGRVRRDRHGRFQYRCENRPRRHQ